MNAQTATRKFGYVKGQGYKVPCLNWLKLGSKGPFILAL